MKNVETLTSKSYQDYLISKLKDPNYAAIYLETHLEENPPDPKLLRLALLNVSEALSKSHMTPEAAKLHRQQIDDLWAESGYQTLFTLVRWLDELGLKLTVMAPSTTHAINQLPDCPDPDQPNLKQLLTQLQQAIETDPELPDPDKADLLEQVQNLAEAKQTTEPAKREGLVRKASKIFEATLRSLPETAKIAKVCSKLLPLILKAFSFPV